MPASSEPTGVQPPRKRADARRNEQTLLDAAADIFVGSGVQAPVRDIAAKASVSFLRRRPCEAEQRSVW